MSRLSLVLLPKGRPGPGHGPWMQPVDMLPRFAWGRPGQDRPLHVRA